MGSAKRLLQTIAAIAATGCQPFELEVPPDAVPSAGCGGPDADGGFLQRYEIDVEGTTRTYYVHLPQFYDPGFPFPLWFLLHGAGGNGPGFRDYAGLEEASKTHGIFVYPDAREDADRRWMSGSGSEDVRFVEALIDELESRYCVDEYRVFVAGHSSGAAMANTLACVLAPSEVRGVGAYAGGGPTGACGGPASAWIGHGTNDPSVPVEAGEASRDHWGVAAGCEPSTTAFAPGPCEQYDCPDETPVVWCEHDLPAAEAHAWPSFVGESIWALLGEL